MAAIDAQLALKYAVSPTGGVVSGAVLRNARMVSTLVLFVHGGASVSY